MHFLIHAFKFRYVKAYLVVSSMYAKLFHIVDLIKYSLFCV